jgi:hypothetical protein
MMGRAAQPHLRKYRRRHFTTFSTGRSLGPKYNPSLMLAVLASATDTFLHLQAPTNEWD